MFTRKMLVLLLLGFSSGLPLSLLGSSLQAWFTTAGVDIVTIGCLALVGQPYSYKFVWAPLLDRFHLPFLDRRRGWIIASQLGVIVAVALMTFFNPSTHPVWMGILAFLLSFVAATQDIVLDAYRTEVLTPEERGFGMGIWVGGYRLAMLVSGGFALFLADRFGGDAAAWQKTYSIMALLMLLGVLGTVMAPRISDLPIPQMNLKKTILQAFQKFLSREKAVYFLVLILLYKLGDVFSHALSSKFLLDLGFSLSDVGVINKVAGLIATILGALVGGIFMTRMGLFRALLIFGILQGVTNIFYMMLAMVGPDYPLALFTFFIENLCGGMGTAAFFALLTALCDKEYSATQYALFSSLFSICPVYVAPASGWMVLHLGWSYFYLLSVAFAIPGLWVLMGLKSPIERLDQQQRNVEETKLEDELRLQKASEAI